MSTSFYVTTYTALCTLRIKTDSRCVAGYRLAAWLNLIVDGKTGLVRREEDIKPVDIHVSLPSPLMYRTASPAKLARRAAGFGCGHEH